MIWRLLFGGLTGVAIACAQPDQCTILGRVVDVTTGGVPNALVRLTSPDATIQVPSLLAERDGTFCISAVSPGNYTVKASANGFRAKSVRDIVVLNGVTTDVGSIELEVAGCEAPGVMCDSVGPPDRSLVIERDLIIPRECGMDLDKGAVICPDRAPASSNGSRYDLDLRFTDGGSAGLFLRAANGARMNPDCKSNVYEKETLRVDGLGPGDDLCVRTKKGRSSHIFFEVADGQSTTTELIVWIVTRKRPAKP